MKSIEARIQAFERAKPPRGSFADRLIAARERIKEMTHEERHQDFLRQLARLEGDSRTMRSVFERRRVAAVRRLTGKLPCAT